MLSTQRLARLLLILAWLVAGVSPVLAQAQGQNGTQQKDPDTPTDLTEGKTPAQLFADGCQVCHQRPQGLAKSSDVRSLASFLRQHYTSSSQTASAMAAYLASLPQAPAAATPANRGRPGNQPTAAAQPGTQGSKPEDARPTVRRPAAGRPDDAGNRAKLAAEPPAPPKPKVPEIPD